MQDISPTLRMTWQEWYAIAQSQGVIANTKSDPSQESPPIATVQSVSHHEQAKAYHFLTMELPNLPSDPRIEAMMRAYDGDPDDYHSKMRWTKRVHLLHWLESTDDSAIQAMPSLHQYSIHQAKKDGIDDVERLWQVMLDLRHQQDQEQAKADHQATITNLAENAPIIESPSLHPELDQHRAKSDARWKTKENTPHDA
ncbi:hypothetical protein PVA45_07830 (plasmid) [Entomospira entomophila]|uniref:Uncharacterized protein n=1 Tax=Entomospira entomophila TaxID=2719988 RepID=A0A968KS39_9SPIO|nr:hypothetical protein [Entomospira entomophilus]NIZ41413.1 hypothetical protein [Entomospira entomophilus]WDI36363.1 hypothetical protein PVA45_07830 [Entomospira entomophilus]